MTEYGVECTYDPLPYTVARWIEGGWDVADKMKGNTYNAQFFKDVYDRPVLLAKNKWALDSIQEKYPDIKLLEVAPVVTAWGGK